MSTIRVGLILLAWSCAEPTATSPRPAAPRIVGQQQDNSYSINAAERTVYVRIVQVRSEGGEPIHAFVRRMTESADSADARRLVIDLRSITGGDARLLVPLIQGIVARDRFVQSGGLYVVVGPNSFSPTQNTATLLQRYANPIFVREIPG
jgi:C-terminal processing protease CtpA/Prc